MSTTTSTKWKITGLLVAGKREDGTAWGPDKETAARHLAAKKARERGCDVAAAIAGAVADRYWKAEVAEDQAP